MPKGYYGNRNWTLNEIFTLDDYLRQGLSDAAIGKRLGRSENAVNLKRKRMGIKPKSKHHLSARDVAQRLGLRCSKSVTRWIGKGYLPARKGYRLGPHKVWWVTQDAFWEFVLNPEYWHLWDYESADSVVQAICRKRRRERWLTTGEVGARLGVEHTTVQVWIARGLLPAQRRGNWLVRESDLRAFVPPCERSRKGMKQRDWQPREDAMLLLLRHGGLTFMEIARRMGRPIGSVSNRWYRAAMRQEYHEMAGAD